MGALALAAGEPTDDSVLQAREAGLFDGAPDQRHRIGRRSISQEAQAEGGKLANGEAEGRLVGLGQHGPPDRQTLRSQGRQRGLPKAHSAGVRTQLAAQQLDQGRLAGSVRADDHRGPARRQRQADPVHQGAAATAHDHLVQRDHRSASRSRSRSQKKQGPPITAVTTPTGISAGAAMVRAMASERSSRIAPRSALAGKTIR